MDNFLINFYENIENGILVPPFYGDSHDTFLKDVYKDLIELSHCNDVRTELQMRYNLTNLFRQYQETH